MKIAFFTPEFFPFIGGAEICMYNLMKHFTDEGHDVTLYAPLISYIKVRHNIPFKMLPIIPKSDFLYKKVPPLGFFLNSQYMKIQQSIYHYDICHIHFSYPGAYTLHSVMKKIPKVLTCHGFDIQKHPELNYGIRLDDIIEKKVKKALEAMDGIVAISDNIQDEIQSLGISENRIFRIPNGASWSRFEHKIDRPSIRKSLNIPENVPLILTTGRNHPKKGYHLIPDIISELKRKNLDFRWLIIGKGLESLNQDISRLKVEDKIILKETIGLYNSDEQDKNYDYPKNDLIDLYLASDIYAFPSLLEGLPLVLPEAMAAGLAVVTTNAPGCIDVIKDRKNGLIAEAGDLKDFAEKVAELLSDKNLMKSLQKEAKAQKDIYDWKVIAEKHIIMYEKLIKLKKNEIN